MTQDKKFSTTRDTFSCLLPTGTVFTVTFQVFMKIYRERKYIHGNMFSLMLAKGSASEARPSHSSIHCADFMGTPELQSKEIHCL